jgi:hypothetical protein
VRHGVLRCESGGTRIVSVIDCDYNNVVFAANEDLFDKMLGGAAETGARLLLGTGDECLHLFVERSRRAAKVCHDRVVSASRDD